jgi:multidrug resistance efflux pump
MSLSDSRIFCVIALVLGSSVSAYITRLNVPVPGRPDLPLIEAFVPVVIEAAGRVQNVYMKEAKEVHAGDLLVQFDTGGLLLKKRALELRIHDGELHASDRHNLLSSLYRELEQLRLDLDRLTITSPIDGRIIYVVPLAPGDLLPAGNAIAVIFPRNTSKHKERWKN